MCFSGSFFLSQSFSQTTSSFFAVALENFLSLLKNVIKFFGFDIFLATFDINFGTTSATKYSQVSRTYDYTTRILFTRLNDAFLINVKCVFQFKTLKYWNINVRKKYVISLLESLLLLEIFAETLANSCVNNNVNPIFIRFLMLLHILDTFYM